MLNLRENFAHVVSDWSLRFLFLSRWGLSGKVLNVK